MKKKKQPKSNILRQPRPLGLTLLAQQTRNQHPSSEVIQRILNYILTMNLEVNKQRLTLSTLASYLNISIHQVMKAYVEYQNKLSNVMLGNIDKVKGALLFQALNLALEDKAQIDQQRRLLQASQGNTYKPFISSSVNEVLGLNMQSTKALMDLYKMLNPTGPSIAIQHNHNGPTGPTGAIKAIGINEALQILNKEGLTELNYDPSYNAKLIAQHGLDTTPEVRATHQAMSNTDGITIIPANPKTKSDNHSTRRVNEEGIDEEEFLG